MRGFRKLTAALLLAALAVSGCSSKEKVGNGGGDTHAGNSGRRDSNADAHIDAGAYGRAGAACAGRSGGNGNELSDR